MGGRSSGPDSLPSRDPLDLPTRHYAAGYGRGLEDQIVELDPLLERCADALLLPLIFHAGGEVTLPMRDHWRKVTGVNEMTTKVMCDTLRKRVQEIQRARSQSKGVPEGS